MLYMYIHVRKTWEQNAYVPFSDVIYIEGMTIYPVYDYPHAGKSFRNRMMDSTLTYRCDDGEIAYIAWSIIRSAYEYERMERAGHIHAINKISDARIYPDKCPKMRTKYAFQILSDTLALYIDLARGKWKKFHFTSIFRSTFTVHVVTYRTEFWKSFRVKYLLIFSWMSSQS